MPRDLLTSVGEFELDWTVADGGRDGPIHPGAGPTVGPGILSRINREGNTARGQDAGAGIDQQPELLCDIPTVIAPFEAAGLRSGGRASTWRIPNDFLESHEVEEKLGGRGWNWGLVHRKLVVERQAPLQADTRGNQFPVDDAGVLLLGAESEVLFLGEAVFAPRPSGKRVPDGEGSVGECRGGRWRCVFFSVRGNPMSWDVSAVNLGVVAGLSHGQIVQRQ
jgi:hypothetical protein